MINISEFYQALLKKSERGVLEFSKLDSGFSITDIPVVSKLTIPFPVSYYFNNYTPVNINCSFRKLVLLPLEEIKIFDDKYLLFSEINSSEKICFDINTINSAEEWDIVNYSNKFLITKTLSSFLTNKTWAWLERGRKIWDQELYYSDKR